MANSRTVSIILTGTNASAIRAIEGTSAAAAKAGGVVESKLGGSAGKVGLAFNALAAQAGSFGVPFAASIGRVGSTLEQAEGKTRSFGSTIGKIGQVEATAAAIGLVAVGTEAIHLADALETAHAREVTAIKNAGQSYGDYADKIAKTEQQMEKFGFTNADTESSIANLTNATHDAGKAIDLQSLAADIARGRHVDLAEATTILMKVETGHVALLGRLGINVKDASGHIISQEEAIRRLSATYAGQAAAAADTFAGKMKTLSVTAQDLGAKLGEAIVPGVEAVASALSTGVTDFENFNRSLDGVPGKILAVGAAFPIAVFAAEKLVGAGAAIVEQFAKVGRFITTGTTAAAAATESAANTAVAGTSVAAAAASTDLAAANAAATASWVAMSGAELATAAATGTISAEELAVVLATQELNAALAEVAATSDIDAIAIDRLAAANTALAVAEHEAALAAAEQAAAGTAGAGGAAAGAEGLGIGATAVAAPTAAIAIPAGAAVVAVTSIETVRTAEHLLQADTSKTSQGVKDLASAFELFAHSGAGASQPDKVVKDLGVNFQGLANAIKVNDTNTTGFFGRFSDGMEKLFGASSPQKQKILETKNALIDLFKVDPSAAVAEYGRIYAALIALHVPASLIGSDFADFLKLLGGLPSPAKTATSSVFELGTAFDALAAKTGAAGKADELSAIADKFDAVNTAQQKVAADKADIAGTSKNATDANRAEADALRGLRDANQSVSDSHQRLSDSYVTLQDAQDRVKTSADGLLRAQEALNKFNSPRGAQERALRLDQIQRTVASSPVQGDAKQLALLQFQDENANKEQSLTDAVISAQKGVRDANRGVEQAQRGIADAERGIGDATQRVADAQQNVSNAVAARKKVHDDAAAAIGADERKVSSAVGAVVTELEKAKKAQQIGNDELGNYLTLLDDVAKVADPGGALSKALDSLIGKMQLSAVLAQAAKDAALRQPVGPAGPIGPEGAGVGPAGPTGPNGVPITVRAEGGPVEANKPVIVGEAGSELFVAKTTDKVVPTAALAASVPFGTSAHDAVAKVASAALTGGVTPASTNGPQVVGRDGPTLFVPPVAGTIVPHDKLAATAAGANTDLKGYAAGGPVDPYKPVIVGEKGPEIFVPQAAGAIISNDRAVSSGSQSFISSGPANSMQNVTTFANTYHINAHDTPTVAELDAINREQSWRLTRSGRR